MKKINSIHFGGPMLLVAFLFGVLVPLMVRLFTGWFAWWLCVPGALVLAVFLILFIVEMRQDSSKVPYHIKHMTEEIPFDPARQIAVIRASICTGEMVAGFKDCENGHFTEVMVLSSEEEKERFMKMYGITEVKKEY